MKEEILKLREEGKTYNEIKLILGCSKGTISYYCGNGQKEKTKKEGLKDEKIYYNKNQIILNIENQKDMFVNKLDVLISVKKLKMVELQIKI